MKSQYSKVAISLPASLFNAMEHKRHELGIGRSAAILEALKLWLHEQELKKLEKKYEAGYKHTPEKVAEVEPFYRAGLTSFDQEGW